jgi:hypothetical protein
MVPLDPPRYHRDVDVLFDLSPSSSPSPSSSSSPPGGAGGGSRYGPDPRNELNHSVHHRRRGRPRAAGQRSRQAPPRQPADLGIRFAFDTARYPAAFVVTDVREGSIAWVTACTTGAVFGVGSRLCGLNGVNILCMPNEHAMGRFIADAVTRASFEMGVVEMRFDNETLQFAAGQHGGPAQQMGPWGAVALRSVVTGTAADRKTNYSLSPNKQKKATRTTMQNNNKKHVIRKPPDFGINRFGRCTPTLGAFTTEKRYKDLEPVHTGTQATPSSFGRNPIGRTAPASSFGTSTRQDWKAVGFNGVVKAEDSGSSGQFSCLGLKNGGAGFGVSERQLPPFKGLDPGIESPGPAAYIKKPMMGPGSLSTAMSATFGAGKRKTISTDKGLDSPGPVYDPKDFDEIGATADMGEYGRGASFGVGPAHVPPGLNISPFKKYD